MRNRFRWVLLPFHMSKSSNQAETVKIPAEEA